MQKRPVMERFMWHVGHRARTHAVTQDHTCFLVWREDFYAESSSDAKTRNRLLFKSHRCWCVWHSTPQSWWPDEGKTHRYGSQLWEPMRAPMRTSPSKRNPQQFGAHVWRFGVYLTKSEEATGATACRTGSFKCENGGGLFSECIFKRAHMLVFYHPPALHHPPPSVSICPPSSFLRGEESSAGCSSGLSPLYELCFCG